MISIIIPVYNQAKKLKLCLDSILNQGYKNFEVIIINDGSTDNVAGVIKKYKNKFPELLYIEQANRGASAARNRGFKESKGNYLIFCDADVVMKPIMLEVMLKNLKGNPKASFCYSSFKWGPKTFKLWAYSAERLRKMPYITTTSLIRREHFPGFDEKLKKFQDWDLWLTMLAKGYVGVWVDKILFKIQTGGTISSWLPSFAYRLMPFLPSVKKYNKAMGIIKKKHNL